MKRSQILRRTPLQRSLLPRLRSMKQARKDRARTEPKRVFMLAHPWCQAGIEGVCTRVSQHCHEPWIRSAGGPTDDPAGYMAVCWGCHAYIHTHTAESRARGWLVRRVDGPAWLAARREAAAA